MHWQRTPPSAEDGREEAGRACSRSLFCGKRVASAYLAGLVRRRVLEAACVSHVAAAVRRVEAGVAETVRRLRASRHVVFVCVAFCHEIL